MTPAPAGSAAAGSRPAGVEPVHPPPRGRVRLLASAFIGAWLLVQLALPASYHLGANPSEERFAWRMFSDVWWYHKTCQLTLVETLDGPPSGGGPARRPVALEHAFHVVWLRQLQRRPAVVEKALRQRCEADPAVREVAFTRVCPGAPPSRLPPLRLRRTCATGVVEREAAPAGPARGQSR
jgi:hypothetical protein